MIDINELRRLAQAATPGPWKVGQYLGSPRQFVIHMDVGDKGRGSDVAFTSAAFGNDETIANARLIAAANPAAISELLDRLEAAESDALEEARLNGEMWKAAHEKADRIASELQDTVHKQAHEIERLRYLVSKTYYIHPETGNLHQVLMDNLLADVAKDVLESMK